MVLKRLVGLVAEIQGILEKYADVYDVVYVNSHKELDMLLGGSSITQENTKALDVLLVAATDNTIRMGQKYHVATLGYLNPKFAGEVLSGVEWLVEGFEEVDTAFLERVYKRYHGIPWEIARTKRCIIREMSLDDMDALFALYQDQEMTKYLEPLFEYEKELEYQRAYINNMYRYYGYGMWLVSEKETGRIIGRAGLEHRDFHGETEVEIGYMIASEFWHQGYAMEVCGAILAFFDAELDFERLNCFIEEGNTPSIKVAKKLGFLYEETIVERGRNMLRFVKK